MEFDHNKVRRVVEEDRLNCLPDDLIHKIMSCFEIKYVVQTCLLSSRWKLLWTSMPFLNFYSYHFGSSVKYSKFVSHVLSLRNQQTEVSSIKLNFHESDEVLFEKIANYVLSHNVQDLAVVGSDSRGHAYPNFLFSSQSLKHFTFCCCYPYPPLRITAETPWDFPALTTLNLGDVRLCGDVFSKFVNLKNLSLSGFRFEGLEEAFDIITPRLSELTFSFSHCSKTINLIAPQLKFGNHRHGLNC